MPSYTKIGEIDEEDRLYLIGKLPRFAQTGGPEPDQQAYYFSTTAMSVDVLKIPRLLEILPGNKFRTSLAVKIPPGGRLHKHMHDRPNDQGHTRYHVVLETNDKAESWNGDEPHHLETGGVYRMEPYLPHEAFNKGDTDRTHLVLVLQD